jgi:drug/metabolite transporter, DME family
VGVWFTTQPTTIVLLALIPGLVALLLFYRGLTATRASYATLAELTFPATAVILNWSFLGIEVSANQILGIFLLWGSVFILSYLNSRTPAPEPPSTMLGTRRTG